MEEYTWFSSFFQTAWPNPWTCIHCPGPLRTCGSRTCESTYATSSQKRVTRASGSAFRRMPRKINLWSERMPSRYLLHIWQRVSAAILYLCVTTCTQRRQIYACVILSWAPCYEITHLDMTAFATECSDSCAAQDNNYMFRVF